MIRALSLLCAGAGIACALAGDAYVLGSGFRSLSSSGLAVEPTGLESVCAAALRSVERMDAIGGGEVYLVEGVKMTVGGSLAERLGQASAYRAFGDTRGAGSDADCGALRARATRVRSIEDIPAADKNVAVILRAERSAPRRLQTGSAARSLRFTPPIITALFVTLFITSFLLVGFCCLGGIQTPQRLLNKGLTKPFKEY